MTIQSKLRFRAEHFDRQALKRADDQWIAQQLADVNSQFLLFWKNKFILTDDVNLHFLDKNTAEQHSKTRLQWKYLGDLSNDQKSETESNTKSLFGAEITQPTDKSEEANWKSLRSIGLKVSPENASLLAFAQGLFNWHAINNFCTVCGSAVSEVQAGHALICDNAVCAKEIFPRTDPAIIVLIHHQDSCLLGRGATWPENAYSCLAGFVEIGEDLESSVKREVFEESGLTITEIEYRGSQPWPFPQSLMLGFFAEATNKELVFHDGELEDARWYSRQQLVDAVTKKELYLSPSLSISYHLLEDWFNLNSERPLSDILSD